jgi:hypothetical protein
VLRDVTDSLYNPFHNFSTVRYEGFSVLPAMDVAKLRMASTDYPDDVKDLYLQLPSLDPRVKDLAEQITAREQTPIDKAIAVESYLRTRYSYTLNLTGKPGSDAIAHFLFETRAGHCEYFASAMAIMLRTIGIPTREVNGFLPGEYNDLGEDYIVRASDAHSWVEVYFPGTGWLTFDPTPPGTEAQGGLFARLGQYIDWFELSWNEWIINYDFVHQIQLAQNLQHSTRNWADAGRRWFARQEDRGRRWMKSWAGGLRLLMVAAVLLFFVVVRFDLVVGLARRLQLNWQLRTPGAPRSNPQLASRLYEELLFLLEKRGIAREDSQTPLEFAAALPKPQLAPAVQEFTLHYSRARFGSTACDTSRLRALLGEIRASLRTR